MTPFVVSQILAAVAFACGVVSFQYKQRRSVLLWLSASGLINACHYFVLGRPGPGALFLLLGSRAFVAAFTVDRRLMYLFQGLTLIGFPFVYRYPLDFVALFATCLAIYAGFQPSGRRMRAILMVVNATWVVHDSLVKSPVAALMELTYLVSNVTGYWRHYRSRTVNGVDSDEHENKPVDCRSRS